MWICPVSDVYCSVTAVSKSTYRAGMIFGASTSVQNGTASTACCSLDVVMKCLRGPAGNVLSKRSMEYFFAEHRSNDICIGELAVLVVVSECSINGYDVIFQFNCWSTTGLPPLVEVVNPPIWFDPNDDCSSLFVQYDLNP